MKTARLELNATLTDVRIVSDSMNSPSRRTDPRPETHLGASATLLYHPTISAIRGISSYFEALRGVQSRNLPLLSQKSARPYGAASPKGRCGVWYGRAHPHRKTDLIRPYVSSEVGPGDCTVPDPFNPQ